MLKQAVKDYRKRSGSFRRERIYNRIVRLEKAHKLPIERRYIHDSHDIKRGYRGEKGIELWVRGYSGNLVADAILKKHKTAGIVFFFSHYSYTPEDEAHPIEEWPYLGILVKDDALLRLAFSEAVAILKEITEASIKSCKAEQEKALAAAGL